MAQDPWAWANQPASAPLSNTLQVQHAPEMAPGPPRQQGPLGMATNIATARGVNAGVDKAVNPNTWQSLGNTLNPGSVDLAANANASGIDPLEHWGESTGWSNTAPGTAEAVMPTSAPLVTSAPLSAEATGATISGAEAATVAGTAAAETAAATAGTAAAGTAAAGTAAAGVGATAATAAPLAAMGPVGWAIGAALLAKQLKII